MEKSREAFRTISEVSEILATPPHVLRFWESRFPQVRPVKRAGGRRYYRPTDVALLSGIKRLLHSDGLTIRGVQKVLREQGIRHVMALADADLAGAVMAADAAPAMVAESGPPGGRVLAFPEAAAQRAPLPPETELADDEIDLTLFEETGDVPLDLAGLSDESGAEAGEPAEEAEDDAPQEEVSLQLTELIAEFVEQSAETEAAPAAPDLPLWSAAPAPAAPPAPPAAAPAASAADLGEDPADASDAAETPRGAWIATELRRLTPAMAAPYSAEFSALGRRLEALRARATAAAPPRKG